MYVTWSYTTVHLTKLQNISSNYFTLPSPSCGAKSDNFWRPSRSVQVPTFSNRQILNQAQVDSRRCWNRTHQQSETTIKCTSSVQLGSPTLACQRRSIERNFCAIGTSWTSSSSNSINKDQYKVNKTWSKLTKTKSSPSSNGSPRASAIREVLVEWPVCVCVCGRTFFQGALHLLQTGRQADRPASPRRWLRDEAWSSPCCSALGEV